MATCGPQHEVLLFACLHREAEKASISQCAANSACSFDGAVAVHTLQFLEPLEAAATALAERLRPSGRLVTLTHAWAFT
jgi:hypothetical protein